MLSEHLYVESWDILVAEYNCVGFIFSGCSAVPHSHTACPGGLLGLIHAHAAPSCRPLSGPHWGLWLPDRRATEGRIWNSQLAPTGRISEFPPALKLCLHTALRIPCDPFRVLPAAISVLLLWNLLSPDFDLRQRSSGDNQRFQIMARIYTLGFPSGLLRMLGARVRVRQRLLCVPEVVGCGLPVAVLPHHLPALVPHPALTPMCVLIEG